jgi:hypothetical protein
MIGSCAPRRRLDPAEKRRGLGVSWLKQRERIKSPNPPPMKTQRESRRMVGRFTKMVARFLHIPDEAAVYVIWAAWMAVIIIIGIIVMLWR